MEDRHKWSTFHNAGSLMGDVGEMGHMSVVLSRLGMAVIGLLVVKLGSQNLKNKRPKPSRCHSISERPGTNPRRLIRVLDALCQVVGDCGGFSYFKCLEVAHLRALVNIMREGLTYLLDWSEGGGSYEESRLCLLCVSMIGAGACMGGMGVHQVGWHD